MECDLILVDFWTLVHFGFLTLGVLHNFCFWFWNFPEGIWDKHTESSHSRPAGTAAVLVGEERALDKDMWLGLETLVTSWFWLVVEDWRLSAPWKEVPLLNVFTTSICNKGTDSTYIKSSTFQYWVGALGLKAQRFTRFAALLQKFK